MDQNARLAMAQAIFRAGLRAADPSAAVRGALANIGPVRGCRVLVAIGKAACTMAEAALPVLKPSQTLVVTDDGNARPVAGTQVLCASHPVPDARGAHAACQLEALADALGENDQLVVLVSGGGSALLPAPVAGISLDDKIRVNQLLLASGADITDMNLVRQSLSRLKGGGLERRAAPAQVVALILSDVVGDDLRVIASGPTVAPIGTRSAAVALLQARGLWAQVPQTVRDVLQTQQPQASAVVPCPARNLLIGSNARSVAAMAQAATDQTGNAVHVAQAPLVGDVRAAAAQIVQSLVHAGGARGVWLWGGETTVVLGRWPGQGGRNQELALRVALMAEAKGLRGWCFVSGGTDGRDGPTDAAGGIVDDRTLNRARAAGIDPMAAAAGHNAYAALAAAQALLITGPTGTNVADLQVLITH